MNGSCIHAAQIHTVMLVPNEAGRVANVRERTHCGIAVASTGSYLYQQNDNAVLSDREHVIFLPRGSTYTLRCYEKDLAYVINFDGEGMGDTLFSVPVVRSEEIYRTATNLSRHIADPYRALSLFYALLSLIFQPPEPELFLAPEDPLFRAAAYMDEHFSETSLRIETLAAQADMSISWFRKRFHSIYGVSPSVYLANLRLSHAKNLLCDARKTIGDIAVQCGYSDVYGFSAAFKKYVGISPMQWRKKARGM